MPQVFVVTYPEPLEIEVQRIQHEAAPDGTAALAYFVHGNMIARGIVTEEGVDLVERLLSQPVPVALAAAEDDDRNIEARVCLLLPVDPKQLQQREEEDEPWKASVPTPPPEVESSYSGPGGGDDQPQLALFPIGNVIRQAQDRNHPDNVVEDAQEMLKNLLDGQARDAVAKAIDDLLNDI